MKEYLRKIFLVVGLCISVYVCCVGIYSVSADQFLINGRDKINPDLYGTDLYQGGEDLVQPNAVANVSLSRTAFPTSAVTLYAVSSSGSDTQRITLDGIDDSWNRMIKADTLEGQTQITLAGSWMRVNTVKLTKPAVGAVTVYWTTNAPQDSTTVMAMIPAGHTEPQRAVFSTPANYTATVQSMFSTAQSTTVTNTRATGYFGAVGMRTRSFVDTAWSIPIQGMVSNDMIFVMPYEVSIGPRSDVVVAVGVTASAIDATATMRVNMRHE